MKKIFLPLFFLTAVSMSTSLYSQEEMSRQRSQEGQETKEEKKDSIIPVPKVPYFFEADIENPFLTKQRIVDTTLYSFQRYEYNSKRYPFIVNRGNVGLASRSLWYNPWQDSKKELIPNTHHDYALGNAPVTFYRPLSPFTELFYSNGASSEQLFYFQHAQRIHKNVHIGFKYMVANSPGYYNRNAVINNGFLFTGDFLSNNKKYQALLVLYTNKLLNHESGGLTNVEGFIDDQRVDSILYYNAESRYRDRGLKLRHSYLTGFYTEAKDTLDQSRFINLGKFSHTLELSRRSSIFENSDKPIKYSDFSIRDTVSTLDSTRVFYLENTISYSYLPLKTSKRKFPLTFSVFISSRLYDINTDKEMVFINDTLRGQRKSDRFNCFVQGGSLATDPELPLSLKAYAELIKGGYYDNDYKIEGGIMFGKASSNIRLEGDLKLSGEHAPYYASRFYSNTYFWENNFDQTTSLAFRAQAFYKRQKLGLSYYLINKPIFFNNLAFPEQNEGMVNIIGPFIENHFNWKALEFNSLVIYQYVSSDKFERLPELLANISVLANIKLFKGSLLTQIGLEMNYNTPYSPMGFNPVSRVFYNHDSDMSEQHIFLDPFLTAKIKRTRFFVKFQDVLGFLPNNKLVFPIANYPIPSPAFKFGLSWMFFD